MGNYVRQEAKTQTPNITGWRHWLLFFLFSRFSHSRDRLPSDTLCKGHALVLTRATLAYCNYVQLLRSPCLPRCDPCCHQSEFIQLREPCPVSLSPGHVFWSFKKKASNCPRAARTARSSLVSHTLILVFSNTRVPGHAPSVPCMNQRPHSLPPFFFLL